MPKLLMISGDRSVAQGKQGAFFYTLEELSKHWDRIDVICPRISRIHPPTPHPQLPTVFFHPAPGSLWTQPRWITQRGSELIAEHDHDVMTVHEYPPFYNGFGALALKHKTGIPAVCEIHHLVGWPRAASQVERIGQVLSWLVLPRELLRYDAVRTVNGEVAERLESWNVPADRIRIVPSFYLDQELLRAQTAVDRKQYDIAFCARLVANKGLLTLLEAIAGIPDATLLVIGDGPLRRTAERKAAALGLSGRVTFKGWLPTAADVASAMASARMFVMNSLSEGGPRVALEAMGLGLPVVATRVGVMPDVIRDGENGLLTDGTPEDLRARITRLLDDASLRERLGGNARAILDRFERTTLIKEYADFLKEVSQKTHV